MSINWTSIVNSAEFISAVTGAVVGGVIAFIIQWQVLKEARRQKLKEISDREIAISTTLIIKISNIFSNMENLRRHFYKCIENTSHLGVGVDVWRRTKPVANVFADVHFSPDEQAIIIKCCNSSLFKKLIVLDASHNDLMRLLIKMAEQRKEVESCLEVDSISGDFASVRLKPDANNNIKTKMHLHNMFIEQILTRINNDYLESRHCLIEVQNSIRSKLDVGFSISPS
jgi:hypothetical protein